MYSDLTLYYLNQLGITPWIIKENFVDVPNKDLIKLVVLVHSNTNKSKKAQSLLKRMMAFINLDDDELLILNIGANDSNEPNSTSWHTQLEKKSPLAILSLGCNTETLLSDFNLSCPVLTSKDPEHLLSNPSAKKSVFCDLSYLNEKLLAF